MTLQALQYFAAAAVCGNFTKAAESCFVTQPALSRAIQELEQELNCKLFERQGKKITLTNAGKVCLKEAQQLFHMVEHLKKSVQGTKEDRVIKVGYIVWGHYCAFNRLWNAIKKDGFQGEIEMVYDHPMLIKEMFVRGELDAAILMETSARDLSNIECTLLTHDGLYIILDENHPLATQKSVTLRMLQEEKFILYAMEDLPLMDAYFIQKCRDQGFVPQIAGYGRKMADVVNLAKTKHALAIGNSCFQYVESEGVKLIPISDLKDGFDPVFVVQKSSKPTLAQQLFKEMLKQKEVLHIV